LNSRSPQVSAPSSITASDGTSTAHVLVSWPLVSGATRYKVFRSRSRTGTYDFVGNADAASYRDTSASRGVTYYYRVSSSNPGGTSAQSTAVDAGNRR
jgi:fibronectin type 3 domain-containing protein